MAEPGGEKDIEIDEWRRSRVHDEVMITPKSNLHLQQQQQGFQQMNASVGAIAASSGHSYEQSGSRSSFGGEAVKVRYIAGTDASVKSPFHSPPLPSPSPGTVPPVLTANVKQHNSLSIVLPHTVTNQHVIMGTPVATSHQSPLNSQGAVLAGSGVGLSSGIADESANRLGVSTTGLAGSVSALAVAGGSGSYLAAGGVSGVAVAGGSGSHLLHAHGGSVGGVNLHQPQPPYQTPSSSHVRTVTIHPASSSHVPTDPSASSSGPGSTNDYYPVFVTPAVGVGLGGGSSNEPRSSNSTTDNSFTLGGNDFAQHQHHQILAASQQGIGAGHAQRHHAVMLPDGSLLAPHLASHYPAPHPHQAQQMVGMSALQQQQMMATSEELLLRAAARGALGPGGGDNSSTTTNAAVWGGSTSRQQLLMTNSASVPNGQPLQPGQVMVQGMGAGYGGGATRVQHSSPKSGGPLPPTYPTATANGHQAGKSQFIGGRGRGGGGAQMSSTSVQGYLNYPQAGSNIVGRGVQVTSPPATSPVPPPSQGRSSGVVIGRGGGPNAVAGRGAGIVIGSRPLAVQPAAPTLGAAPSILIGKLPTPTFTQTISVGGMKLGTSKLVAPRFPGQAEEVLKVSPSTPTDTVATESSTNTTETSSGSCL